MSGRRRWYAPTRLRICRVCRGRRFGAVWLDGWACPPCVRRLVAQWLGLAGAAGKEGDDASAF